LGGVKSIENISRQMTGEKYASLFFTAQKDLASYVEKLSRYKFTMSGIQSAFLTIILTACLRCAQTVTKNNTE
jgi:hypothetical protein